MSQESPTEHIKLCNLEGLKESLTFDPNPDLSREQRWPFFDEFEINSADCILCVEEL